MAGSVKTFGIVMIVLACLQLLGGLCLGGMGILGGAMIGSMTPPPGSEPMPEGAQAAAAGIVGGLYGCLGLGLLAIGLLGLLSGLKLVKLQGGRTGAIVYSILNLPSIPIGTAIGIWGLVILLKDETKELLAGGAGAD